MSKTKMSAKKTNLRLIGAFAVLATLALAASCRGFFVKPTISSLSVGPASPTIETGSTNNTVQMFAVGTFNDGSTGNPSVSWTIDPTTIATISSNGLVTSVATGSATITATSNDNPSITGTQSLTVTVGCIQSITLKPTSGTITTNDPSFSITATAATCNGSDDVTSVATWTSSNPDLATVSAGTVSMISGNTTPGQITVTATIGSVTSNPATITVSP
jgi:trimeric autotransporter adhesin